MEGFPYSMVFQEGKNKIQKKNTHTHVEFWIRKSINNKNKSYSYHLK